MNYWPTRWLFTTPPAAYGRFHQILSVELRFCSFRMRMILKM